ncbi:MAG: ribosome-associated translation inhibitor RaiA [Patescibacteria group bacterium]
MNINIHCTNIDATEPIKQYAMEKMAGLGKFFSNIQQIDIDVGMKSRHHLKGKIYYAECNVSVPGKLIRVSKNAVDLYKAIDKVRDHLKVEFEKMKGKRRERDRNILREQKGYLE